MILVHKTVPSFWQSYNELPEDIRRRADKQFQLLTEAPSHGSLHLKPVGAFWSARVTDAYRALAYRDGFTFTWFWIGSHDEYERMLNA